MRHIALVLAFGIGLGCPGEGAPIENMCTEIRDCYIACDGDSDCLAACTPPCDDFIQAQECEQRVIAASDAAADESLNDACESFPDGDLALAPVTSCAELMDCFEAQCFAAFDDLVYCCDPTVIPEPFEENCLYGSYADGCQWLRADYGGCEIECSNRHHTDESVYLAARDVVLACGLTSLYPSQECIETRAVCEAMVPP